MDNLVAESGEAQIDGLDFSLPTTSMAVTSRRFVNFFHQAQMFIIRRVATRSLDLTSVLMTTNF